jgi:hypothetical protein
VNDKDRIRVLELEVEKLKLQPNGLQQTTVVQQQEEPSAIFGVFLLFMILAGTVGGFIVGDLPGAVGGCVGACCLGAGGGA